MANCTKAQAMKWNEQLMNGFGFDLYGFIMSGDKMATKTLPMSDGRKLQAKLRYEEVRENWKTVGQQPILHLSIWEAVEGTEMMRSYGMGATIKLGDVQKKKAYNVLCKLSGAITDDEIKKYAVDNMAQLKNESLTFAG